MSDDASLVPGEALPRTEDVDYGFHTTHWSVVMLAGQADSNAAASALETLCRAYWYPLYGYARRRGHGPPDAQDLTQHFFSLFLEKNYFEMADPERGRFRCFLLASFKNFLANQYNRSRAARHGGQCTFISWDAAHAEAQFGSELGFDAAPDKLFDRAWAMTLLERVMNELRQDYARAGKAALFESLQIFLTGEKPDATYREIGVGLAMSEAAVKMAMSRLRQRYGEMLRREVAHTVVGAGDVEEELRHLFSVLG